MKVIDFSLADADSYAVLKGAAGTRRYAAPEQLADGIIDCRADLYALGRIMEDFRTVGLASPAVRRLVRRCTALDRSKRPASAQYRCETGTSQQGMDRCIARTIPERPLVYVAVG